VKDLVFLGRVLKNVCLEGQVDENEEQDSGEESENKTKLSLLWMIRRMRKIVNIEIVQAPKSTAMVSYAYILSRTVSSN
jgi:U3 small nucleolar RNA-associated protein 20